MTEAMTGLLESNKGNSFSLSISSNNEDSKKVAKRLGFQKVKKKPDDNSIDVYIKST